ncbi:MAG: hypothetical protein ACT4TC_18010 [Myxococcaceae bacterium]
MVSAPVRRAVLLLAALSYCTALAGPSKRGSGRVSVQGGWRFGLNGRFYGSAAEQGYEREKTLNGGPALMTVFGYSATDLIEISIDPFVAYESLRLVGVEPMNAWIYGAMVSARVQGEPLGKWLTLNIGLSTGGLLVNVTGGGHTGVESFGPAFGGTAGAILHLNEVLGLSLEYKVMFGQGVGTAYGEARGNGHFVGLGLTYFFDDLGGRAPLTN